MDKPCGSFAATLVEEKIIEERDVVKIDYALAVLQSEGIKTFLLILIFGAIGVLKPFFFLMSIALPLRIFCGGIHLKSSVGCLFMSLAFYVAEILVLPQIDIPAEGLRMMLFAASTVICISPLAPSVRRPIRTRKKYIQNRAMGIGFCLTVALLLLFGVHNIYLVRCGVWALCVQAIQQMIVNGSQIVQRRTQNV